MKIIKSNTYNVVSADPFDIPMPLEFEVFFGNSLLAAYKIAEDGRVDYSFNPSSGSKMLTSTQRSLDLRDIYFLFSSRVFPDNMPFTQSELERFGVKEYNPYEIAKKTHGIMPADQYWFKFPGEDLTYKKAAEDFGDYFKISEKKKPEHSDSGVHASEKPENSERTPESLPETIHSLDSIMNQKSNEFTSINDVNSILNQNALDIEKLKGAAGA